MTVVLACAGAFVYWPGSYALDRQLDQDLRAYADITARQVPAGATLLTDSPGEAAQLYTPSGSLISRSNHDVPRLASPARIAEVTGTARTSFDVGRTRVTVTDEGPGVPEALGARAFDRFTRAEESPLYPRQRAGAGPGQGSGGRARRHRRAGSRRGAHRPAGSLTALA